MRHADVAAYDRIETEDRAEQFGASRTDESGQSDDLAAVQLQVDRVRVGAPAETVEDQRWSARLPR